MKTIYIICSDNCTILSNMFFDNKKKAKQYLNSIKNLESYDGYYIERLSICREKTLQTTLNNSKKWSEIKNLNH